MRPVRVTIEDVPHVNVLAVINDCIQMQAKARPTFLEIEKRLSVALVECNKELKTAVWDI